MPKKAYLLFSMLLVAACLYYLAIWPIPATDTDLWYHLNGGRYFFETGSITRTSFFSFMEPQRTWVDYYWLFQVSVYKVFSSFGYIGLILFRCLLSGATLFALILYFYRDQKKSEAVLYCTVLFVFYVLLFLPRSLPVRPHLFSYLFIIIFLYILEFKKADTNSDSGRRRRLQRGADADGPTVGQGERRSDSAASCKGNEGIRVKANWYMWLLVPLAVLWVNLHGIEYPVMLLILGAGFAEYASERVKDRRTHHAAQEITVYTYPAVLILSAAAVLCTPHGIKLLGVPFKNMAEVSQFIYELRPLSMYDFFSFFGIIFFLSGFIALHALWKKKARISNLILFLGGLALLLEAKRFVNEFALLALPLLRAYIPDMPATSHAKKLRLAALVLSVAFMAMPFFFLHYFFLNPPRYPLSARELPEGVALFLRQANTTGTLLNYPDSGGYLEWELYPRCKIFMDLQVPFLFTAEDFGMARRAYTDPQVLRDLISRYRPRFITVPIGMEGFRTLILNHPQYRPVFFDDAEVLYADASREQSLVSLYELKFLDPYSLFNGPLACSREDQQTLQELQRLSTLYPRSGIVSAAIAATYSCRGHYSDALPYTNAIITTHPDSHLGYHLRANLLSRSGRYREAVPFYRKAIERSEGIMKQLIEREASECRRRLDEER